jgi:hypothetical protein
MAEAKTGEELITAHEAAEVQKVSSQVAAIREQALGLEVRNATEAEAADRFLGALKTVQKEAEETRKFLVKPLNDHVKAINGRFRPNADALEQAERAIKGKVISYNRVQEELRRAEQERIDAERRAAEAEAARRQREAEAEAARQRAEAEAQARAAAEAAERERMEAVQRDENSRRARIGRLPEDALKRIAEGGSDDAAMAQEELGSREAHREAQAAAERAAAAEQAAREAEEAAKATPAVVEPERTVTAPVKLAGTATRKRWTFEVIDPDALPDWARTPDMPEIRRRVRDGVRDVPGLRIYQEDELAVRAR